VFGLEFKREELEFEKIELELKEKHWAAGLKFD